MSKLKKFASIPGNSNMYTGYRGLINQGATCYLNTVLQTFFMTPEFRDAVHEYSGPEKDKEKNLLFQLKKLFQNLEDGEYEVKTTGVTKTLGMMHRDVWIQQDVAEFFRKILNEVSKESPVSENYQSTVINSIKCLRCGTEASDNSRYLDIPLALNTTDSASIMYSVEKGLLDFLKTELLEGDNQSYCDKCEMKTDTETRYYFQRLPQILTLHLKRFEFDYNQMSYVKIQCPVEIPLELQFQKAPTENTEWYFSATIPQSMPQQKLSKDNKRNKEITAAVIQKYILKRSQHGRHSNSVTHRKKHDKKTGSTATGVRKKLPLKMKMRSRQKLNKPKETLQEIAVAASKSQDSVRYELFAICDHSGGYRGGHYTARIKSFENDKWYTFNDSFVHEYLMEQDFTQSVKEGKRPCISSSTAYLLMYRKSETSKPDDKNSVNGNQRDPRSTETVNGNQRDPRSTETVTGNQRDPSCTETVNCEPHQLDPSGLCYQERPSRSQPQRQGSDDAYTGHSGAVAASGRGSQSTGQRGAATLHRPAGGSAAQRPTTPALLMNEISKPDNKNIVNGNQRDPRSTETNRNQRDPRSTETNRNQRDPRSTESPKEGIPDEVQKWDVPAILGKKKDGSWCLSLDYKKINPVTKKDSYLLHRINEALDYIVGSCWFSSLDLRSGDSEIQLSLEVRLKTVDRERWQFQVKLFGLYMFECLVERVLVTVTRTGCFIYLDDLEVHTPSF